MKPEAAILYNNGKAGIDFSDQMTSYAITLRKGVKWLTKLGIQLMLGMTIVNALVLFQTSRGRKINIRNLRESIYESMLQTDAQIISTITRATPQSVTHTIVLKKTKIVRDKEEVVKDTIQELAKKMEAQWRKRS